MIILQKLKKKINFLNQIAPVGLYFSENIPNLTPKLIKLVKERFKATSLNGDECACLFIKYRKIGEAIQSLREPIKAEISQKTDDFSANNDIFNIIYCFEKPWKSF